MRPRRAPRTPLAILPALLAGLVLTSPARPADPQEAPPPRGFLGVSLERVSEHVRAALALEEGVGVLIRQVVQGGAAEEAGLQEGDVVIAAQGRPVRGPRDLVRAVQDLAPADILSLDLWRHGRILRLEAVLQERPEPQTSESRPAPARTDGLGLTLMPLTDQLAEYFTASGGVLVTGVAEGSPAEVAGVLAGDVIVAVDGHEVGSAEELHALLTAAPSPTVLLGIIRNGADISVHTANR